MMHERVLGALLVAVTGVAVACSSANGESKVGSGGSGGTAGSADGSAGSGGGLSGNGGGSGGLPPGCAADTYGGQLVPLDMFIMLDRSGSMNDAGKWPAVTNAINSFVQLPDAVGIGIGLGVFPTKPAVKPPTNCAAGCGFYGPCLGGFCTGGLSPNDSCIDTDYATPVVPIATLPGAASAITSAINAQSANGASTPTTPALRGAMQYATPWAAAHPDHITVVVLATDGDPNNCDPNDVSHVALAAQTAYQSKPSVRTFVIGVGSSLTSLNQIAQSGGTDKALIVDTASDPGKQFLDALNQIRGAVGCTYNIPDTGGKTPDFKKVNVGFTPDGSSQDVIPYATDANGCQGGPGWYYDVPPPGTPNQIILCPSSCDLVTHQPGKVDVVVGCEQIVK